MLYTIVGCCRGGLWLAWKGGLPFTLATPGVAPQTLAYSGRGECSPAPDAL